MKNQGAHFLVVPPHFSNNAFNLYSLEENVVSCISVSHKIPSALKGVGATRNFKNEPQT